MIMLTILAKVNSKKMAESLFTLVFTQIPLPTKSPIKAISIDPFHTKKETPEVHL